MSLEEKIDIALSQMAEIKATLSRPMIAPLGLTLDQVGELTGIRALSSRHQFLKANKVYPYARGLYRRADVERAVAGATLATAKRRAA